MASSIEPSDGHQGWSWWAVVTPVGCSARRAPRWALRRNMLAQTARASAKGLSVGCKEGVPQISQPLLGSQDRTISREARQAGC